MQFDTLRAFPYPVLRPDVDDYVDGDIQVTVEFFPSDDGQEVTASGNFYVSVHEIQKEVTSGRARYVVVFACRDTYYRHVHASESEQFQVSFPAGSLRGEVQIYSYILATQAISNYQSAWINPEFGSGPFKFAVGSVLALDRPQAVFIDRDVFRSLASVFVLAKEDSLVGYEWQVRTTDNKVHILLSPEMKERIDQVRNNKAHRAVLMNSIYFAAVMQCVSLLKNGGEEAENSRWGSVILQRCHNEGINIEEHGEYLITQRLMKSPLQLLDAYVFQGGDA